MEPHGRSKHTLQRDLAGMRAGRHASPIERFIRKQVIASGFLGFAIISALFLIHSPWAGYIDAVSDTPLGFTLGQWELSLSVKKWINDGLLALFFFLVGLDIKREILIGQLRHPRQALLVVLASVGGMIVPALIYLAFNHGTAAARGWAIPMTTDTAFAIGALALMARHVSARVSIFLAAVAIIDDIGAILVIALYYSHDMQWEYLIMSLLPLLLLFAANFFGLRQGWLYFLLGAVLWWFIAQSGVHATLAGILMAYFVPAHPHVNQWSFILKTKAQLLSLEKTAKTGKSAFQSAENHQIIEDFENILRSADTPLQRWHCSLETPVLILVLPLFALLNAGVRLDGDSMLSAAMSPVAAGIVTGLVIGKPIGISLFAWAALRLRLGKMSGGMTFREIVGSGMLTGIGFTMSLFITNLSFDMQPELIGVSKIAILLSSLLAALAGFTWIFLFSAKRRTRNTFNHHGLQTGKTRHAPQH